MQRARAVDSFTEAFDLNEGSLPSNAPMDHSGSWDNIPIENRTNGWNNGDSSSITHNLHEDTLRHDSDARIGWSSAFHPYSATDPTSEAWSFQPSYISSTSHAGNQLTSRLPTMPMYVPNRFSHNIDSSERDTIPTNCYPSSNRGKHSGASSSFFESTNLPGSSSWGPSYKRKALEDTSGQFSQGGSSSSNAMPDNFMHYNAFGNYTPSPIPPMNMSNNTDQLNSRNGVGVSGIPPRFFPSSTNPRLAEGSSGHHNMVLNNGYRDTYEFETIVGTSVGHHIVSGRHSRPVSNNEIPTTVTSQARLARVSEQREMPAYPWNGSVSSQASISSNSLMEINERSSLRNNLEYPVNFSSPETRNVSQDHIDWSFHSTPSAPFTSRPSNSRIAPSSGGHASSSSPSLSYMSRTLQDHQRLVEASLRLPYQPWMESESASHFESFSSAEAAVASRQRLIRHVLRAMSSGVELPPELDEFVLIDPLMNGFFELHDQHRDMRLDVDNMSYEELLALEEEIGNVNTGLSEAKIWGSMGQRRHGVMRASPNLEPCCICQENYIPGDEVGILDCAHEFHSCCISQWLKLKNLCPICKMTALKT